MRTILATTILALVPTAALANDGTTMDGFGSVAAGYSSLDQGDYTYAYGYFEGSDTSGSGTSTAKQSGLNLEGRVSVAVPVAGALGAQVDGVFSRANLHFNNCSGCSLHLDQSSAAVHLFVRNPHKGLIGVVGQRSTASYGGGYSPTTYFIGAETQLYMGRVTYSGQMGYAAYDNYGSTRSRGLEASIEFRYFPSDNLFLSLRGGHEFMRNSPSSTSGYNCPSYCYSNKASTWDVGGKVEYRFAKSRFSLLAQAEYGDNSYRSDYIDTGYYWSENTNKSTSFRAMLGVKVNFGAGTLFERDRSGASLEPFRPLTNLYGGFEN